MQFDEFDMLCFSLFVCQVIGTAVCRTNASQFDIASQKFNELLARNSAEEYLTVTGHMPGADGFSRQETTNAMSPPISKLTH